MFRQTKNIKYNLFEQIVNHLNKNMANKLRFFFLWTKAIREKKNIRLVANCYCVWRRPDKHTALCAAGWRWWQTIGKHLSPPPGHAQIHSRTPFGVTFIWLKWICLHFHCSNVQSVCGVLSKYIALFLRPQTHTFYYGVLYFVINGQMLAIIVIRIINIQIYSY